MPQLQKAIPVAAVPFKKFLRVVIGRLPDKALPMAGHSPAHS
jgi:hypothetical protein